MMSERDKALTPGGASEIINQVISSRILTELQSVESEENVVIVYACESGSRAWGFASQDSDYDVRFVYVRPPEFYTAIDLETKSDVIERPIADSLDLSGWDLRKTLQLLRKSNPPLLEWLSSPIVYRSTHNVAERLRSHSSAFFSRRSCMYHYLHMAQGNFRAYLQGDEVWLKKYLYVLRPILGVLWLEQREEPVPMQFHTMVDSVVSDRVVRNAIEDLLDRKRSGSELDRGPRIAALSDFIESQLRRMEKTSYEWKTSRPPPDALNQLFRSIVHEVWGYT